MFGALRLFLAAIVVVYHAGFNPFGLRIGATAVIVFYIISGYVISALYITCFKTLRSAHLFYLERTIRILPQYYFYLLLAFSSFYGLFSVTKPQLSFSFFNLFSNMTLFPLAIETYLPALPHFRMLPQTYSLANELIFYLLTPLLMFRWVSIVSFVIGFAVFAVASHGLVSVEHYTYYYLPAPIMFFLFGYFIYKRYWFCLSAGLFLLIMNQVHLAFTGLARSGLTTEIYLGLYAGLLLVLVLGRFKQNKLDNQFANLSYGCFLVHYPLINIFLSSHYSNEWSKPIGYLVILVISLISAAFSYNFIEKPLVAFRKRWRYQSSKKQIDFSTHMVNQT